MTNQKPIKVIINTNFFLITGDKDLLILEKFKSTKIVTYQDFLQIILKNKSN